MTAPIIPVILCGGAGSRLWPLSRESHPKQLISFTGSRTLLQDTLQRASGPGFARPIIVTADAYRFRIAEQVRELGLGADIVLEPQRRDSAAAVAAAALIAARRDAQALLLVLAADHAIPDTQGFHAAIASARPAAESGHIVTFGIRPLHPATGYGYIKPGEALSPGSAVREVAAFVEKPDAATAERYVSAGYLWNSGNFMAQAGTFLDELAAFAPDILSPLTEAVERAVPDLDFLRLDPEAFGRARPLSIDYAVMEKTHRAAVLPAAFTWSDIGSWDAIWSMTERDANGNGGFGDALFHDSRNCYVHSPDRLTALAGVDNLAVITTRDAVLVLDKARPDAVKAVVATLAAAGRAEASDHARVDRPWGYFEPLDRGAQYQVKRLHVKVGSRLSLQKHAHRAEHWVVVEGRAKVRLADSEQILEANQSIYIPLGAVHRLENAGKVPLVVIEVQTGSYLGEDDIVRLEV